MRIPNKTSSLSLFNIKDLCSEDLEPLLKSTNINFHIIAILKTKILKDTNIVKNINNPIFLLE